MSGSKYILPTHYVGDGFCDGDGNEFTGRYEWYPYDEDELDDMDDNQLRALESRCRRRAKKSGLRMYKRGNRFYYAPIGWKDQSELTGPMNLCGLYEHFLAGGTVTRVD